MRVNNNLTAQEKKEHKQIEIDKISVGNNEYSKDVPIKVNSPIQNIIVDITSNDKISIWTKGSV